MSSQIEINAGMRVSLDIRLKGNNADRLTLASIVEEIFEDRSILIQMPIYQGYHYPLPRDEFIIMKFFVDSELYALPVQFEERIERDGFMFARMRRGGRIEEHQQRDCYRIPFSLPVNVERLWYSEGTPKDYESHPIEGRMINFSDGGMLFATDENFEKDEKITVSFDIGVIESVECMIIRTEIVEDGRYRLKAAVQFKNLDKTQKRRFYKYIVDKQMEQRRRWTPGRR